MFFVERKNSNYQNNTDGLRDDFHDKCYICERQISGGESRHQIEHRIPKSFNITDNNLKNDWNLFYACSRCNGNSIKGDGFCAHSDECQCGNGYLGIIDCTNCNPYDYFILKNDLYEPNLKLVVTITSLKNVPCTPFTIDLLKKVYTCSEDIPNRDLTNLLEAIYCELAKIVILFKQLHIAIYGNSSDSKKVELCDNILKLIKPDSPFSVFKHTYLQEQYNDLPEGNILKEKLKNILNNPSLHPKTIECCIRD